MLSVWIPGYQSAHGCTPAGQTLCTPVGSRWAHFYHQLPARAPEWNASVELCVWALHPHSVTNVKRCISTICFRELCRNVTCLQCRFEFPFSLLTLRSDWWLISADSDSSDQPQKGLLEHSNFYMFFTQLLHKELIEMLLVIAGLIYCKYVVLSV